MAKKAKLAIVEEPLKLDLGCGKGKRAGFLGVDMHHMEGVDLVADLSKPWPWKDDSAEEVHCSHFLEHVLDRPAFFNELYRVMKPGAKCMLVTPHWASNRAYGDPTHVWPPVSEMLFYYLSRAWRMEQAPHTDKKYWHGGFDCDFECTWGYSVNPGIANRNQEYQQHALSFWKEAAQDIIATLTKK